MSDSGPVGNLSHLQSIEEVQSPTCKFLGLSLSTSSLVVLCPCFFLFSLLFSRTFVRVSVCLSVTLLIQGCRVHQRITGKKTNCMIIPSLEVWPAYYSHKYQLLDQICVSPDSCSAIKLSVCAHSLQRSGHSSDLVDIRVYT